MKNKRPPIPKSQLTLTETAKTIIKMSTRDKDNNEINLSQSNTQDVYESIKSKIIANDEILKLFPDVEIAIQILVASILSPNDLISNKLLYNLEDLDIPNNVNTLILETIRTHINKNYKLEDKLPKILRETLFTKGAYAEAIIPDTDVERIIKDYNKLSTESHHADYKFLGNVSNYSLSFETEFNKEDLSLEDNMLNVEFTENLDILRLPDLKLDEISHEAKHITLSYRKLSAFKNMMQKKKDVGTVFNITTNNLSGAPMILTLPVTSVLPIHLTSDPSKHISYLVLLDENGVPITETYNFNSEIDVEGLAHQLDIKASIIKKTNKNLNTKLKKDVLLNNVNDIYINALKTSIKNKIEFGKLGKLANIPEQSDFYQIVFMRAAKGLKTRLLYIPKENLAYFAFEYRDNGTGKSLLEKSMMLFSIRATNLFTRIMANIKNSVTTTKVTAQLDPNDPDPERTKEMIINEAKAAEQVKYPIGNLNIKDLINWMHNVGYRFDIKHPMLPEIEIDISDESRSVVEPDEGFDEMIQEHIIMSFGLTKEMVRSGFDPEFATTVVAHNALFAKRVSTLQKEFKLMLSRYVGIVLRNDGILRSKIYDILQSNIKSVRKLIKKSLSKEEYLAYKDIVDSDEALIEYIYQEYCDNIVVGPPEVEISAQDATMDALDSYSNLLDTYLEMIISSETLPPDLVGNISDKMDDIRYAIKTILIKNWIDDHNFIPELSKFLTLDNTGKPRYDILDEYSEFTDTLAKAILPHLKELKRNSDKLNNKLDKIESGEDEEPPEDDTTPEPTEDTTEDIGEGNPNEGGVEENTNEEGNTEEENVNIEDENI